MNDRITKSHVRTNFRYARDLMRQADAAMKSNTHDFDDLASIESELIACVATFSQWIEDQREEVAA
jgi:hypothetical protein